MDDRYFSIMDLIIGPLYLILIYFISKSIQLRKIKDNPSYKYYLYGLFFKLFGGLSVCLIYVFYYGYGDTLNYYSDSAVLTNVFLQSPLTALKFTFVADPNLWYRLDDSTGYLMYISDVHAIVVVQLTWLLCLFSFKSYIGMTFLLAWISFFPIWRFYQMLIREFPNLMRPLAFALFFIPSVFFWGSGLLKDTITFCAVCLFASSYSIIMIEKRQYMLNIFLMIIASLLLVNIKPYIFFALLPGTILWYGGVQLAKMQNKLLRSLTTPFLITVSMVAGYFMLRMMSGFLGEYSLDNVLDKALVTQQDLKSDRYEGNSFDIGDFESTVPGILSKVPAAINAALFRPYLWETNNMTMLLSGLENVILLGFTIYLLIKLKVINFFRLIFRHRILFFTVYFSMFFAFSVGLTTSNFGSLVRYKIPAIPFFVISLVIIWSTYNQLKAAKEKEEVEAGTELKYSGV
jgi:hypothetical protein